MEEQERRLEDIFLFPGSLEELNNLGEKKYEIIFPEGGFLRTKFIDRLDPNSHPMRYADDELKRLAADKNCDGVIRYLPIITINCYPNAGRIYSNHASQGVPVREIKDSNEPLHITTLK